MSYFATNDTGMSLRGSYAGMPSSGISRTAGDLASMRSSGVRDVPVIDVEDVHARIAGRFGPEVAAWCERLPPLADDLARQWGLRIGRS